MRRIVGRKNLSLCCWVDQSNRQSQKYEGSANEDRFHHDRPRPPPSHGGVVKAMQTAPCKNTSRCIACSVLGLISG